MNPVHATPPPGKEPLDFFMWFDEVRNRDLAKKTGIGEDKIGFYRRGMKPRPEHAQKLADGVGRTLEELGYEELASV